MSGNKPINREDPAAVAEHNKANRERLAREHSERAAAEAKAQQAAAAQPAKKPGMLESFTNYVEEKAKELAGRAKDAVGEGVNRVGNGNSQGQERVQADAIGKDAARLKEVADRFNSGQCYASRPELQAISNEAAKPNADPNIVKAAERCGQTIAAGGYKAPGQ